MTDEEKIKFIAQHTRMKFGDMAWFVGMRPSSIMDFIDEHEDEIALEIKRLNEPEVSE